MTSEDINKWIPCDKCGESAQALYLIKLVDGELAFCGHHYNKFKEALDKVSYEIIQLNKEEETPQLTEMAE
jgi:ArsR family metal-binding transcriptional regulator